VRIGCRKCGYFPRLAASRNSKLLKASSGGIFSIIEHQAPLGFTVCSTVSPQEKEIGYTLSFSSTTSLGLVLEFYELRDGKGRRLWGCMQCLASLRNIRVPE